MYALIYPLSDGVQRIGMRCNFLETRGYGRYRGIQAGVMNEGRSYEQGGIETGSAP